MRHVAALSACVLSILLPATAMAQADRNAREQAKLADAANTPAFTGVVAPKAAPGGPRGTAPTPLATAGTIQYDDGVFNSVPVQPAGVSDILSFGNRFNTQNGNPIPAPSITVNSFAVWPALVDGSSTASAAAFITLFGPVNTAGTNAAPISSNNYPGVQPGTWNTLVMPAPGVVSPATGTQTANSFLIGMFGASNGPGTPCNGDCIGFSTGTTAGQGFHAMRVDDFGGGDFGAIGGFNALIRPTGNVLPVELMSFSVDEQ